MRPHACSHSSTRSSNLRNQSPKSILEQTHFSRCRVRFVLPVQQSPHLEPVQFLRMMSDATQSLSTNQTSRNSSGHDLLSCCKCYPLNRLSHSHWLLQETLQHLPEANSTNSRTWMENHRSRWVRHSTPLVDPSFCPIRLPASTLASIHRERERELRYHRHIYLDRNRCLLCSRRCISLSNFRHQYKQKIGLITLLKMVQWIWLFWMKRLECGRMSQDEHPQKCARARHKSRTKEGSNNAHGRHCANRAPLRQPGATTPKGSKTKSPFCVVLKTYHLTEYHHNTWLKHCNFLNRKLCAQLLPTWNTMATARWQGTEGKTKDATTSWDKVQNTAITT